MSENEVVALALGWLVFSTGLIAAFALAVGWLEDRAERRKAHHAAE
ncbi:MAG TPA: hypothetical protein VHW95_00090 [Steroidobacteraceae bacterium]|jgi:hypothetical protein|nr:hypothetical protein [Steroidobacteraceae bacterium]